MNSPSYFSPLGSRHFARFTIQRVFRLLFLIAVLGLSGSLCAQTAGVIQGRVYNAVTKAYVRNAEVRVDGTNLVTYTEDGGFYRLVGVVPGGATVTVNYTGSQPVSSRVTVGAEPAVLDFELGSDAQGSSAESGDTVKLAAFVISGEREGQAKMIMDQRAALNAKSVVSSDNFGDLTMGDVGEFLKYMPGMSLDFLEVDAFAPRIGGLDAKYSTFTQDGTRMASSQPGFDTNSRGNTFEQMSITGIEAVEVNNTLTASMDADSVAGNINLRSRNAFDRKERQIVYQAYAMGTSDAITLTKSYLPDEKKHFKVFPAGQLGYGDTFFNHRLGIEVSTSYNASFVQQDRNQVEYNYTDPDHPVITGIMWRPGPKMVQRVAGNFGLDFKITPDLVFSWRSSYSDYQVEFFNQYTWLRASTAQITPDSTLSKVTALSTANANTRLGTEYSHRHNYDEGILLAPKLEYKKDSWTVTLRGGYSHSQTANHDMEDGFFRNTNDRITRTSWTAERSSPDSPTWNVAQLSGPDWSVASNWGSRDTQANNIVSNADKTKGQAYSGNLDVKKTLNLAGLPIELKTGLGTRLNTYTSKSGNLQWTYVGPTGNQLQAVVPATQHYVFHEDLGGKIGNINSLGWRADDTYGTYTLFQQHPEWFVPDTFGNFTRTLIGPRSIKEQIDAAYVEGTTRWHKLRFDIGLRGEHTRTLGKIWDPRTRAEILAAGYTVDSTGIANTPAGYFYQYHNGQRASRYGDYNNLFLSSGAKYSILPNLQAQLAMSDAILRPDYPNLAGVTTVSEASTTVTVPNPNLKPETSTKYFASLQYYFEPAGTLSLSAYRLNVKNQITNRTQITAAQAGLNEADYPGYTFLGYVNGDGKRRTDGVILDYDQQLTFLPGAFRGLSIFGSVTRVIADQQRIGLSPKTANGGIRYRWNRFNVQVRGTWQAARLISITTPLNGYLWLKERTLIDVSGGYKINSHLELMLSARNVLNASSVQFSNEPGRVQLYDVYGSLWNVGIKGTF